MSRIWVVFSLAFASLVTSTLLGCGGGLKPGRDDAGLPPVGDGDVVHPDAMTGCSSSGMCVEEPFGPRIDYEDVWGAADDAVWVVGTRGTVRFFDGMTWSSRDPEPNGGTLRAVHGSGPTDVWAVGDGGAIWHWTAAAWTRVPSGTTADLYDVSVTSATEAFASGADATMLRWNGTQWLPQSVPVSNPAAVIRSVSAPAPGRAFATDSSALYEWNGTTWTSISLLTGLSVGEVHVLPDRVLMLVSTIGGYYVFQYMNGTQTQIASGGRAAASSSYAMFARAADQFTVVGSLGLVDDRAGMVRRSDYHGSHVGRGVWTDSTGRVWAVGEAGTVWKLDAGAPISGLRVVDAGDQHTMLAVHARTRTDVWMAGLGGKIVHFDGASWTSVPSGTDADLHDITAAPDGSIWAAGKHGAVVQLQNGTATAWPITTDTDLYAIVPDGAAGVWVAGGRFERWSNGTWTQVENLFQFATDAWSPAAGEIWLAHADGYITRYVDGVEQTVPRASQNDLWSIWGTDANHVIAGAYANSVYRFDGNAWTEDDHPFDTTPGAFYGVWGTSAEDVVLVGDHVIERRGGEWIDAALDGYTLRRIHGAEGEVWAVGWRQNVLHRR